MRPEGIGLDTSPRPLSARGKSSLYKDQRHGEKTPFSHPLSERIWVRDDQDWQSSCRASPRATQAKSQNLEMVSRWKEELISEAKNPGMIEIELDGQDDSAVIPL